MTWHAAILAAALAANPEERGPWYGSSTVAGTADWAFWGITILCAFFFVLIVAVMLLFMWKYRQVGREIRPGGPSHHTPLEVTWTVIPLILVVAIFWIGAKGYINLRVAPQGSYEVKVLGQKWFWTLYYPNGATATTGPYASGDRLIFPEDRPIKLLMESSDVLHAFFIPEFRVKQDIVPGRITTLWFEATTPGIYSLFCAEYCGKGHSEMLGTVQILPQEEFDAAIHELSIWIDKVPEQDLWWNAGPRLYNRCAACHTVDGKDSIGPTFKGLYHKLRDEGEKFTDGTNLKDLIAKGEYASEEDYIQRSIWFPQEKIVFGRPASMPTFKGSLNERERRAIIEFIKHLSTEPDNFEKDGKVKNPPAPSAPPVTETAKPGAPAAATPK